MQRAVWGLPQAGILANKHIRRKLTPFGYYKHLSTPGIWYHETRPILFMLVVNNFGVKYVNKEDIDHLVASIKKTYTLTKDWTGNLYCSFCLDWDYKNQTVDISMPGYVKKNCKSIITLRVNASKLACIHLPQNSSVQRRNLPSPQIRCQNWIRQGSRRFKKCWKHLV